MIASMELKRSVTLEPYNAYVALISPASDDPLDTRVGSARR